MDNVFTMECYECGAVLSEEDDLIDECPFCGDMIYGEDVLRCPTCDSLYTSSGDIWECENCGTDQRHDNFICECPSCGAVMDGEYCGECGWPDVNQGWLGEQY